MNNKLILLIIPAVIIIILIPYILDSETSDISETSDFQVKVRKDILFDKFGVENEDYYVQDGITYWKSAKFALKQDVDYSDIINHGNAVVIVPVFTASAYESPAFYDYYNGVCDKSCLTAKLQYACRGEASCNGAQILNLLGYDSITDVDVDTTPEILKQYDTIIILHNEYVTQKEFDAILDHPNVIYLYPNSNYGLITVDYQATTISLIRGHGYPEDSIINAFDWEYDNTPMEFDSECQSWEFYDVGNGKMLNCYPEVLILQDIDFLKTVKSLTSR